MKKLMKISLIVIGILFALFIGLVILAAIFAEPAQVQPKEKPAQTQKQEEPPEKPSTITTSQKQAIRKAESYLDIMAFSHKGLVSQLEYEGFSAEDAEFAVSNISVDWNAQAAKKAKNYLDIMAFSRQGLIKQLEYEGFTHEQAIYGVTAIGL